MSGLKTVKDLKEFRFSSDYSPEENFNLLKAFESFSFNNDSQMVIHNVMYSRAVSMDENNWKNFLDSFNIDIFRSSPLFFQNTESNYFEDLSYVVDENLIPDSLKKIAVRDGKVLALPECLNGLLLIYNKNVLNELGLSVPQTWDDFYNVLKEIKKQRPDIIPFALHNLKDFHGWWAYYLLQAFLVQLGTDISEINESNVLSHPDAKIAIDFLKKLISEDLLETLDDPEYESRASVAFSKGKLAFMIEGPWSIQHMLSQDKNIIDKVGVTVLRNKEKKIALGGRFLAIRSKSENSETALQFIQYLVQEGDFFRRISQNCTVPGIKNFIEEENTLLQEIEGLLNDYGYLYPIRPDESAIWENTGDIFGEELKKSILK